MNPLIATLERRDTLSDEEKEALSKIQCPTRKLAAGDYIVHEGDRPYESTLVLSGWACRCNTLRDGARQISALHVAGDFVDLHSFPLHKMDHAVMALTPCTVASFPHEALIGITEKFPHLTRLLWMISLIDAAIHRRWLVAMGRQPSASQLAHLLCEMHARMEVVGLVENNAFNFPLTQSELGDVLGLSLVHVNRVVQELKRTGFVEWKNRRVKILDSAGLCKFAEFDPLYLHLETDRR